MDTTLQSINHILSIDRSYLCEPNLEINFKNNLQCCNPLKGTFKCNSLKTPVRVFPDISILLFQVQLIFITSYSYVSLPGHVTLPTMLCLSTMSVPSTDIYVCE